jgi:hypothetical protein
MTIYKLFENFRHYVNEEIINEAAPKLEQMSELGLSIVYEILSADSYRFRLQKSKIGFIGAIEIKDSGRTINGKDLYFVTLSQSRSGYGPLLYDAVLAWVTSEDGMLMADRASVSELAMKVWEYYMKKRPDVSYMQLDDNFNTLTPEPEDNISQHTARMRKKILKDPLSKAYFFNQMPLIDIDKMLMGKQENITAKTIVSMIKSRIGSVSSYDMFLDAMNHIFPQDIVDEFAEIAYEEYKKVSSEDREDIAQSRREQAYEFARMAYSDLEEMPSIEEFKSYFEENIPFEYEVYGELVYKRLKELFDFYGEA